MVKRNKSAPSIYDVAKLAGVSPSTVSRYLNRTTYVSDEKSTNIEKAIQQSGYKPPYQARRERQGRSMTIGVLVQHPDSPYTTRLLNDLEKSLNERGYSLLIATGHWKRNLEMHALDYLARSNVDGVIVVSGTLTSDEIAQYARQTPVVAVGYQDINSDDVSTIELDNVLGGYMATLHLLQLGHMNIAHIKGKQCQPDGVARFEGYKKALSEAGIPVNANLVKEGNFSAEEGYQKTVELIEAKTHFTAIFAANDQTAYGAIKALHDNGLKVPQDVSVIGFDDLPTSHYFTPALTTLRQPMEELGVACAETILTMLNGGKMTVRIPPINLSVRQSTRSIFE